MFPRFILQTSNNLKTVQIMENMYHDQFNDPGKGKKGLIIGASCIQMEKETLAVIPKYTPTLCYKDHKANKSAYITEL